MHKVGAASRPGGPRGRNENDLGIIKLIQFNSIKLNHIELN